jgi:hypothetical protein
VTEIKQRALNMKLQRDRMIQEDKERREKDRLEEEKKREEQGIDWGMGKLNFYFQFISCIVSYCVWNRIKV